MAHIHKVELYFVDVNENFETLDDLVSYIENQKYAASVCIVKSESKSFEWDDDVVVNKCSATSEDYNSFFESVKESEGT